MSDIKALRVLRKKFDFDNEEDRRKFVKRLESCIENWAVSIEPISSLNLTSKDVDNDCLFARVTRNSQLPDLKLILEKEEIDRLLTDALYGKTRFMWLAIKTFFRDEPDLDGDGQPVTRRTTALHRAAKLHRRLIRQEPPRIVDHDDILDQLIRRGSSTIVNDLFLVYNNYEANYVDEDGLTHLHVACLFGCEDVARMILEQGADPNCRVTSTGCTTLHLALRMPGQGNVHRHRRGDMVRLLLQHGANPNLADERGRTALHWICEELGDDWYLALTLLELCDKRFRPVKLDAKDKRGDMPLGLAMESENELLVRLLLKNGADRTLIDSKEDVISREVAKCDRFAMDSDSDE